METHEPDEATPETPPAPLSPDQGSLGRVRLPAETIAFTAVVGAAFGLFAFGGGLSIDAARAWLCSAALGALLGCSLVVADRARPAWLRALLSVVCAMPAVAAPTIADAVWGTSAFGNYYREEIEPMVRDVLLTVMVYPMLAFLWSVALSIRSLPIWTLALVAIAVWTLSLTLGMDIAHAMTPAVTDIVAPNAPNFPGFIDVWGGYGPGLLELGAYSIAVAAAAHRARARATHGL